MSCACPKAEDSTVEQNVAAGTCCKRATANRGANFRKYIRKCFFNGRSVNYAIYDSNRSRR